MDTNWNGKRIQSGTLQEPPMKKVVRGSHSERERGTATLAAVEKRVSQLSLGRL